MTYKRVYICSKLRGDVETNKERARLYCKYAIDKGYLPICPHIYFTQFLDDNKESDRALAFKVNEELLSCCDELWVCHYNDIEDVSEGMSAEIQLASMKYGLTVRVFDFPKGFMGEA